MRDTSSQEYNFKRICARFPKLSFKLTRGESQLKTKTGGRALKEIKLLVHCVCKEGLFLPVLSLVRAVIAHTSPFFRIRIPSKVGHILLKLYFLEDQRGKNHNFNSLRNYMPNQSEKNMIRKNKQSQAISKATNSETNEEYDEDAKCFCFVSQLCRDCYGDS